LSTRAPQACDHDDKQPSGETSLLPSGAEPTVASVPNPLVPEPLRVAARLGYILYER